MKVLFVTIISCFYFCAGIDIYTYIDKAAIARNNDHSTNHYMKITVGSAVFTAAIIENAAAKAFEALLPLRIYMLELNGNEKYGVLPKNLPINEYNPISIQIGDIMLYGSNTVVLFYKSFSTVYDYTKLGKVNDTTGYVAALGRGNVTVIFEVQ